MTTIAIYGSRRQQPYLDQIRAMARNLHDRGITLAAHPKLFSHLCESDPGMAQWLTQTPDGEFPRDAALVISLGGDGTFLRTAHWVGDSGVPILGVNTGHLGYLTAISVDALPELTQLLSSGTDTIENLRLIEIRYPGCETPLYALNEVTVTKDTNASILNIDVSLDLPERHLATYRADGIILSTPAGSSAYNLSLGGPVCAPTADVMVLTPIAAHSLSLRPLVLTPHNTVIMTPRGRSDSFRLSVDGNTRTLAMETPVTCTMAPFSIRRIVFPGNNLADTLRQKLNWGG